MSSVNYNPTILSNHPLMDIAEMELSLVDPCDKSLGVFKDHLETLQGMKKQHSDDVFVNEKINKTIDKFSAEIQKIEKSLAPRMLNAMVLRMNSCQARLLKDTGRRREAEMIQSTDPSTDQFLNSIRYGSDMRTGLLIAQREVEQTILTITGAIATKRYPRHEKEMHNTRAAGMELLKELEKASGKKRNLTADEQGITRKLDVEKVPTSPKFDIVITPAEKIASDLSASSSGSGKKSDF